MIAWPAIVKYEGDAELVHIGDAHQWEAEMRPHGSRIGQEDALIDSDGKLYHLVHGTDGTADLEPTGHFATLQEIVHLVRAHAAQEGVCCVTKFHAASIAEAIDVVQQLHRMR